MKTLYITDMDGTLLDDSGRVSATSAAIISDLTRRGVYITVATARTPATVEPLLADTLTAPEAVVMTGAAIWNRPQMRFESMIMLPQAEVDVIMDVLSHSAVAPFCYVLDPCGTHLSVYHAAGCLSADEAVFVEQRRGLKLKTFHLATPCPTHSRGRVVLFFGMGSEKDIIDVAEKLRAATDCYVSYYKDTYTDHLWLMEIFARGVSKAEGIDRLRRCVKADRVVVFGDNLNDIAMMQAADVAVAVENALPQVKAIADVIIGPNTADSVARYIAEVEGVEV